VGSAPHREIAMKLYYAPGACSLGIHVILEEIGKPYDLQKLDLQKQEQYASDFTRINPKSKVPTLMRDDGSVLTEFPAIATWLARTNPDKSLLPSNAETEARAMEAMDYVVSTMHMQGFSRMFRPVSYAPSETDHDKVKARGREIMEKGLELMDKALAEKDYLAGEFTIADAALFYVEFWASRLMKMTLPKNCAAHYERMKNRPAVKRVLDQEGLSAAA
jgi:glutathione S-transferase